MLSYDTVLQFSVTCLSHNVEDVKLASVSTTSVPELTAASIGKALYLVGFQRNIRECVQRKGSKRVLFCFVFFAACLRLLFCSKNK